MLPFTGDQLLQENILSDTIINSLPGIFYLYNDKLEFLLWNKNFETILGYTSSELKALPVLEVLAPEDRVAVKEAIDIVFEEGYNIIEACAITKHGDRIPFFFTGKRLIYDGQVCLLGTGIDISSRLFAEQELRTSEQKYKLLFDSNPAPMWMIAKDDLSIIAANAAAAKLYGYTEEELTNMKATAFRPTEDLPLQQERYQREVNLSEPTLVRHLKKDGSVMMVNIYSFDCVFDGRPARLSITHDITEQLKAEQSLNTAYLKIQNHIDSIKNMAWKQSHLIRSPLANLKGLMTLLKQDPADGNIITHIETELERMDSIIIEMANDASIEGNGGSIIE